MLRAFLDRFGAWGYVGRRTVHSLGREPDFNGIFKRVEGDHMILRKSGVVYVVSLDRDEHLERRFEASGFSRFVSVGRALD